jgi:hypothetical protein
MKFDRDSNADTDRTGSLGDRASHMADAYDCAPSTETLWDEKKLDNDSIGTRGAADIRFE